jgi:hypothetical protein
LPVFVLWLSAFQAFGQQLTVIADKDSTQATSRKKEGVFSLPDGKEIEIIQMVQLWDVQTLENQATGDKGTPNDLYIRRGRLGARGKISERITATVVFAYDGIGRQKNTPGHGSANPDDNHDFFLWDAFGMWTAKPMFNLTAGYFRPQVGREHMTAAFNVISFEKTLTNFQPRTHLLARGTGREVGLNVGGLHLAQGWSFSYNAGIFDPSSPKIVGSGSRWAPLLAGRIALTLGDAEQTSYKIQYAQSYFGKRKGVTLAVNATNQGQTEVFRQNNFYGVDLLANTGHWDLVAEYDWLYRKAVPDSLNIIRATTDRVYSVKVGYNFPLRSGKILQATVAYSKQQAANYPSSEGNNALTGASGQQAYDAGFNYLLNKDKLKLNLHYVWGEKSDNHLRKHFSYLAAGLQFVW